MNGSIKNYFSLVKFSHTIFAMPFAIIGFFLGIQNNPIDWYLFIYVVLCMIFARNAAMAFNRWTDAKWDRLNPRTKDREIPANIIKPNQALAFVIINALLFIITTWFINRLCFYLSPVALCVILGYSLSKRFTSLCHLILGIGLALAPIGAYLSVTAEFAILPVLFSFVVLFWVSGFDIIYALQDDEFDNSQDLYSIPARIGRKNALRLSEFLHIISATIVIAIGIVYLPTITFGIAAIVFIGLLVYQHLLVKHDDLSKVNLAFFTMNGIASVIFGALVVLSLYL